MLNKIRLIFDTAKYLKPTQIYGQINRSKILSRKYKGDPFKGDINEELHILIPELDLDKDYLCRFDIDNMCEGKLLLLNEIKEFKLDCWEIKATPLWRFNLHYMEYGIPLVAKYKETHDKRYLDHFKRILSSWNKFNSIQEGEGWHPYTVSMRIPNILICFDILENSIDKKSKWYIESIQTLYIQYQCLKKKCEIWQLGNHYFENLKTLVIGSLLFNEIEEYHKYFKRLMKQINEQILADGVHCELSLMYHKNILESILRVHKALESCGYLHDAKKLESTIRKMVLAMVNLEKGIEKTPLFNDSGNNVSKNKAALVRAAEKIVIIPAKTINYFSDSGYYKLYVKDIALIFDCGQIGPDYLPGHGHCDCLSFELSKAGRCIFSNSGTGQYQGKLRSYFRSTKAHNTMMIDDREQSELWGEYRVARRINQIKAVAGENYLQGNFTSYYGDRFSRRIEIENDIIDVLDKAKSIDQAYHSFREFFHLTPGLHYVQEEGKIYVNENEKRIAIIILPHKADFLIHRTDDISIYADEFGKYKEKEVLEVRTQFQRSVCVNIKIKNI